MVGQQSVSRRRGWRRRLSLGKPEAAVYGTVIAAAVIAGEASAHARVSTMAVSVAATLVVYWLAHGYCDLLAEQSTREVVPHSHPGLRDAGHVLVESTGILASGAAVVVVLVGLRLLRVALQVSVNLALGFAMLELAGWGVHAARRAHLDLPWVIVYALLSAALGAAIVVLKLLLH